MNTADSPVKAARMKLGLTRAAFGAALNRSYGAVAAVEGGYSPALPPTWEPGLTKLGISYDELAAAYAAWRGTPSSVVW